MVLVHYRSSRPTLQLELDHHARGARPNRKRGTKPTRNARGRVELPGGARSVQHWRADQTELVTEGQAHAIAAAAKRQGCLDDFEFTPQDVEHRKLRLGRVAKAIAKGAAAAVEEIAEALPAELAGAGVDRIAGTRRGNR